MKINKDGHIFIINDHKPSFPFSQTCSLILWDLKAKDWFVCCAIAGLKAYSIVRTDRSLSDCREVMASTKYFNKSIVKLSHRQIAKIK